jgi:Kef-type K+ transport system membrane component KefB
MCAAAAARRHASKELVQLSLVGLCLISAWLCGRLGLSEELGAFIAGELSSIHDADCL